MKLPGPSSVRTGPRVLGCFMLVLIVMGAMTAIAIWRLHAANEMTEHLVHRTLARQQLASDWLNEVNLNGLRAISIAKSDSLELGQYFEEQLHTGDRAIESLRDKMLALETDPGEATLVAAIAQRQRTYMDVREQAFRLKESGRTLEVEQLVAARMEPGLRDYAQGIARLLGYQKERAEALRAESALLYKNSQAMLLGLGMLAIAIGALLAWLLTRSIVRPLEDAVRVASAVARGDLTHEAEVAGKDEIADLMRALREMQASLARIVGETRGGAEVMAASASRIEAGNRELSARAGMQAGALEETAASMAQLTATVKNNADHARQANEVAHSASELAVRGGAAVGRVVETMDSISGSANRIVDIIGVIDGIAFQTNILALNAAVEAVRAGEQGRGFSVVAAEVRSLAQRSAGAAREIKALIGRTVGEVQAGAGMAAEAGATMRHIVQSAAHVTDIVAAIAAASAEQASGIEQVNLAIAEMERMTRQNASLVEEAAAASHALRGRADGLAGLVSVFETGERQDGQAADLPASDAESRVIPLRAGVRAAGHAPGSGKAAHPAPSILALAGK